MQAAKIVGGLVVSALTMGAVQGCGQEKAQVPVTPAAVPEAQSLDEPKQQAVQMIADAQCDRAERCKDIGSGEEYSTREHCMAVMRKDAEESVGECRQGIDRDDLAQCLGEIQTQDCGGISIEGLETWVACQSDDLCLS